jgi:hypothetical protein
LNLEFYSQKNLRIKVEKTLTAAMENAACLEPGNVLGNKSYYMWDLYVLVTFAYL